MGRCQLFFQKNTKPNLPSTKKQRTGFFWPFSSGGGTYYLWKVKRIDQSRQFTSIQMKALPQETVAVIVDAAWVGRHKCQWSRDHSWSKDVLHCEFHQQITRGLVPFTATVARATAVPPSTSAKAGFTGGTN